MTDVIEAVKTKQDEIKRSRIEQVHRAGVTNLKGNVGWIARKSLSTFRDHARGVIYADVFANPFGKMESRAASPDAQIKHSGGRKPREQQPEYSFLRRLQVRLASVAGRYFRETISFQILFHESA